MILLVDPFTVSLYLVSFIPPPQENFLLIKYLKFTYRHDRNCFLKIKQLIVYSVYSVLK